MSMVYRKKTHTDQYLNFMSHHPLHQKLGVIMTLFNRCDNVATEEEDWKQEKEHITSALKQCSFQPGVSEKPKRTYRTRVIKGSRKLVRKKRHLRGTVTIPYVKGLSEAFSRILKTYRICTAVRPHTTLRSMLVHPKDKIIDEEKPEVVYKIPCKNCERVYVGETGRLLTAGIYLPFN